MSDSITKVCSKCNQIFPATTEYFDSDKSKSDGLYSSCKNCKLKYRQANKDKISKYMHTYYQANKDTIDEKHRLYREANPDKDKEQKRQYYQRNKEYLDEKKREYWQANIENMTKKKREYYQANKAKFNKLASAYAKANPDKYRIYRNRRQAKRRSLPDTFTEQQWLACLEYFNYCCAVCGAQLRDLFGNVEPHADHWIPLSYDGDDNPGTVVENMVCLCNSCNRSKSDKSAEVWLKELYGGRKARAIYNRIMAYFNWAQSLYD